MSTSALIVTPKHNRQLLATKYNLSSQIRTKGDFRIFIQTVRHMPNTMTSTYDFNYICNFSF